LTTTPNAPLRKIKAFLNILKRIRAGEARKSFKLGSTSLSLNREPLFLVDAPSREAKENCNCKSHVEGLRE
jgi:hypothetical protein